METVSIPPVVGLLQNRYAQLREDLDKAGYREALSIDSITLVQHLFNDLVQTTGSLQTTLKHYDKYKKIALDLEEGVEPFQNENARLASENSRLRLEILRTQENLEDGLRDYKSKLWKVETENKDLQVIITQFMHKVKVLEADLVVKSKTLLEVHKGNVDVLVDKPDILSKEIKNYLRKLEMEASSFQDSKVTAFICPHCVRIRNYVEFGAGKDPQAKEYVKIIDSRIDALQIQLQKLKTTKGDMMDVITSMEKKVKNREIEIEKLRSCIRGQHECDGKESCQYRGSGQRNKCDATLKAAEMKLLMLEKRNLVLEKKLKSSLLDEHDRFMSGHKGAGSTKDYVSALVDLETFKSPSYEVAGLYEKIRLLEVQLSHCCKEKAMLKSALSTADPELHDQKNNESRPHLPTKDKASTAGKSDGKKSTSKDDVLRHEVTVILGPKASVSVNQSKPRLTGSRENVNVSSKPQDSMQQQHGKSLEEKRQLLLQQRNVASKTAENFDEDDQNATLMGRGFDRETSPSRVPDLQVEVNRLETVVSELHTDKEELQGELGRKDEQLTTLRKEHSNLNEEIARLSKNNESSKVSHTFGPSTRDLEREVAANNESRPHLPTKDKATTAGKSDGKKPTSKGDVSKHEVTGILGPKVSASANPPKSRFTGSRENVNVSSKPHMQQQHGKSLEEKRQLQLQQRNVASKTAQNVDEVGQNATLMGRGFDRETSPSRLTDLQGEVNRLESVVSGLHSDKEELQGELGRKDEQLTTLRREQSNLNEEIARLSKNNESSKVPHVFGPSSRDLEREDAVNNKSRPHLSTKDLTSPVGKSDGKKSTSKDDVSKHVVAVSLGSKVSVSANESKSRLSGSRENVNVSFKPHMQQQHGKSLEEKRQLQLQQRNIAPKTAQNVDEDDQNTTLMRRGFDRETSPSRVIDLQGEVNRLETVVSRLHTDKEELQGELGRKDEQLTTLRREQSNLHEEIARLSKNNESSKVPHVFGPSPRDLEREVAQLRHQLGLIRAELDLTMKEKDEALKRLFHVTTVKSKLEMDKKNSDLEIQQLVRESQESLTRPVPQVMSVLQRENFDLSQQLRKQNSRTRELEEEIVRLKGVVTSLDRDKDRTRGELKEKDVLLHRLKKDMTRVAEDNSKMALNLKNAQLEIGHSGVTTIEHQREVGLLRQQSDTLRRDCEHAMKQRDEALRELRVVSSLKSKMEIDKKSNDADIEKVMRESDELKRKLQKYIDEVRRIEELLLNKDEELTLLIEQYRTLVQENSTLEAHRTYLEREAVDIREEVRDAVDENVTLKTQLVSQGSMVQAYEKEIESLSEQVAALETQLNKTSDAEKGLEKDVSATREMLNRLESQSDALKLSLAEKEGTTKKLEAENRELRVQMDRLETLLTEEKDKFRKLEEILTSVREKEFLAQKSSEELSIEKKGLVERLTVIQTRTETLNLEVTRYRLKSIELQGELDRVKRQLDVEKTDRKNTLLDLRKLQEQLHSTSTTNLLRQSMVGSRAGSPSRTGSGTSISHPHPYGAGTSRPLMTGRTNDSADSNLPFSPIVDIPDITLDTDHLASDDDEDRHPQFALLP